MDPELLALIDRMVGRSLEAAGADPVPFLEYVRQQGPYRLPERPRKRLSSQGTVSDPAPGANERARLLGVGAGALPVVGEAMDIADIVGGARRVLEGEVGRGALQAGLGAASLALPFSIQRFMKRAPELGADVGGGGARAEADLPDEPPAGHVRLYRGVNPDRLELRAGDPTEGRWFTTDYDEAVGYANWDYEGTGELGPNRAVLAVDVPEEDAWRFAREGSRHSVEDLRPGLPIPLNAPRASLSDESVEALVSPEVLPRVRFYEGDEAIARRDNPHISTSSGRGQKIVQTAFKDPRTGEIIPTGGTHGNLFFDDKFDPGLRQVILDSRDPSLEGFLDDQGNFLTRDEVFELTGVKGESVTQASLNPGAAELDRLQNEEFELRHRDFRGRNAEEFDRLLPDEPGPLPLLEEPEAATVTLRHYTNPVKAGTFSTLDPEFHGTGQIGAERARRDAYPEEYIPRVYAYGPGKTVEPRFRQQPFVEFEVPSSSLIDRQGFDELAAEAARQLKAEAKLPTPALVTSRAERLARERGVGVNFDGTVELFEPVPLPRGARWRSGFVESGGMDSAIAAAHRSGGGSTFNPRTGESLSGADKWAVATPTQRTLDEAPTPADIAAFRAENAEALEDPHTFIGTWHDKEGAVHGKHELNLTRVYDRKQDALRAAVRGDENSIFNLSTFEEVAPSARDRARIRAREGTRSRGAREATIREIEEGLLPDELEWFRGADKGTRERVISSYLRAPSPRALASAALEGGAQRGWYEGSARAIADSFGEDAPRFAALLAAQSPQRSVEQNLKDALNMWADWNAAGRPVDPDAIEAMVPRTSVAWQGTVPNSVRALTADAAEIGIPGFLSGPKVDPFAMNLIQDVKRVVLDTHMARGAGTPPESIGNPSKNAAVTAAVRNAARDIEQLTGQRLDPREVQETVWSTIYGARGGAGRRPVQEALPGLREADLLGETELQRRVRSSPTFGTLLERDDYRQLLERAGGRPLTGDYRPSGLLEGVPEGAVRSRDLMDLAERIDAVGRGKPFFSLAPLLGLAGYRGLLGGDERRR